MKKYAVALVLTKDAYKNSTDIRLYTSIIDADNDDEALGIAVKDVNKKKPKYALLISNVTEV